MTLILTVLAVLAGLTLLLAVCPRRRKQVAYGAAFVLAGGAFGLANGIPTVGGDAMAQPGCTWDGTTLTCPGPGNGGVDEFCDNPSNGLHGLCNDYSGGGGYPGGGSGGYGGGSGGNPDSGSWSDAYGDTVDHCVRNHAAVGMSTSHCALFSAGYNLTCSQVGIGLTVTGGALSRVRGWRGWVGWAVAVVGYAVEKACT